MVPLGDKKASASFTGFDVEVGFVLEGCFVVVDIVAFPLPFLSIDVLDVEAIG